MQNMNLNPKYYHLNSILIDCKNYKNYNQYPFLKKKVQSIGEDQLLCSLAGDSGLACGSDHLNGNRLAQLACKHSTCPICTLLQSFRSDRKFSDGASETQNNRNRNDIFGIFRS